MKKKILFIILSVLIIAGLTACSDVSKETVATTESTVTTAAENTKATVLSTTEKETTASETTMQKSESSSATTTRLAEQKSAGQNTTRKVTTTQKSTTTKRQTTTKKVTTTQKPTTTKKVTTTEDDWDCSVDGHSWETGPIGWCNSYEEAEKKAMKYIDQNADDGGYRIRECYYCGKFTAKITLD